MKSLVVYYSRTGVSQRVAQALAGELSADTFRITDGRDRHTTLGYWRSVWEARKEKTGPIDPYEGDISQYDVVILCAPVWEKHLATPALSFLQQYASQAKNLACALTKHQPEPTYPACIRAVEQATGKTCPIHVFLSDDDPELDQKTVLFAQKLYRSLGKLVIGLLPRFYTLCTLNAQDMPAGDSLPQGSILLSRGAQEVQLVCPMGLAPAQAQCAHNWRMFSIQGPLAFAQAGIMKNIGALFTRNAVESVCLPGGQQDKTDYILVRSHKLEKAIDLLRQNYYEVESSSRA